jgi:hypothetical protein
VVTVRPQQNVKVTDGVEGFIDMFSDRWTFMADPNRVDWAGYISDGSVNPYGNQPLNPAICDAVKATGATVSVLYVTYSMPTLSPTDTALLYIKNNILPAASTTIQKCASDPSRYYSANSPAEIKAAALSIFSQISKPIRLTN